MLEGSEPGADGADGAEGALGAAGASGADGAEGALGAAITGALKTCPNKKTVSVIRANIDRKSVV